MIKLWVNLKKREKLKAMIILLRGEMAIKSNDYKSKCSNETLMLNDYNRGNHTNQNVFKLLFKLTGTTYEYLKSYTKSQKSFTYHMGDWELHIQSYLGFQIGEKTVVSINYINTCLIFDSMYNKMNELKLQV